MAIVLLAGLSLGAFSAPPSVDDQDMVHATTKPAYHH
jgi:hypothetical protein